MMGVTLTKPRRLLALVLALVLVLAACADSDDAADSNDAAASEEPGDFGDSTSDTTQAEEMASTTVVAADGDFDGGTTADRPTETTAAVGNSDDFGAEATEQEDALGSGPAAQSSLTPADLGRDIVFTAFITVEVDDVASAGQAAVDAIAPLGGLVFGQETTADPRPRTVLTIKVRPADFDDALARLGEIGELRDQTVSAEDVTERVVDLESRIVTAEASVERLRGFLDNATTLEQVAAMERELQQRETDLELLRGQLRTVRQAVSLATITLTIEERQPDMPEPALSIDARLYVGHDGGRSCGSAGLPDLVEGDEVTICYVVANTGDVALGDLDVNDPSRSRRTRIEPVGGPVSVLDPGDSATFFAELELGSSDLRSTGRVSALVAEGEDLAGESISAGAELDLFVDEDDSLPGVAEVVSLTLSTSGRVIYVVFLGLIVATPALLIAAVVFWLVRRRQRATRAAAPRPEPAEELGPEG